MKGKTKLKSLQALTLRTWGHMRQPWWENAINGSSRSQHRRLEHKDFHSVALAPSNWRSTDRVFRQLRHLPRREALRINHSAFVQRHSSPLKIGMRSCTRASLSTSWLLTQPAPALTAPDTDRQRSLGIQGSAPCRFVSYPSSAHHQSPGCGYKDLSRSFCWLVEPSRIPLRVP